MNLHGFDEIILSTLPTRVSSWLRLDLPHKVAGLGLPGDDGHRRRAEAERRSA